MRFEVEMQELHGLLLELFSTELYKERLIKVRQSNFTCSCMSSSKSWSSGRADMVAFVTVTIQPFIIRRFCASGFTSFRHSAVFGTP